MISNMYMFFDRGAQCYVGTPFLMTNDVVFKRNMSIFISSPQFPFKDILEDIQIYQLGSLDMTTGKIVSDIKLVGSASDFKKTKGVYDGD